MINCLQWPWVDLLIQLTTDDAQTSMTLSWPIDTIDHYWWSIDFNDLTYIQQTLLVITGGGTTKVQLTTDDLLTWHLSDLQLLTQLTTDDPLTLKWSSPIGSTGWSTMQCWSNTALIIEKQNDDGPANIDSAVRSCWCTTTWWFYSEIQRQSNHPRSQ